MERIQTSVRGVQVSYMEIPWLTDAATQPLLDIYAEGNDLSQTEAPTRVLIADGRKRVRFGLRILLEKQSYVEVVGEVDEASALVETVQGCCVDLVLMDWGLPGLEDGSAVERLRAECPDAKLIVLSGQPEAKKIAMAAGADAFVNKTESPVVLLSIIEDCCVRETYTLDDGND